MNKLNDVDGRKWNSKWLEAFAGPVFKSKGTWVYLDFRWHAFSFEMVPAVSGKEADVLFEQQDDQNLIGITDGILDLEVFSTTKKEIMASSPVDFIVFPEDCLWTMAYTHEAPWIGHFFSWNPNKDRILAKREGIRRAKENGWMS